jgi:hypothetical protein
MRKQSLTWPPYLRRDHPLVSYHTRRAGLRGFKSMIFGSSIGLFLLFGSLSLPMLYLLISLIIKLQLSAGTAYKIQHAKDAGSWDLIRATPFSRRAMLLSVWAASLWQVRGSWLMPLYRLLHALVIIAGLVFRLWFVETPPDQALVMLVLGTLLIAVQPYADMYLSGMVGLWCAQVIRDRHLAPAAAGLLMLLYWVCWIGAVLLIVALQPTDIALWQVLVALSSPLALPLVLGVAAQKAVEQGAG